MKRLFVASALLLAAAGHSAAADLIGGGVAPEAPVASYYDWSGAYVGAFGGWAHARTKATDIEGEEYGDNTPGAAMSMSDDGFIGGVTAGYNFQSGAWVFGPEVELGWAGVKKTHIDPNDENGGLFTQYGLYGAAAGRVGYAIDRTLFYGKGGLAFAQIKSAGGEFDGVGDEDDNGYWGFDGSEAAFGKKTRLGWTIGAGVEHALSEKWTVKAEYLFADFGSKTYQNLEDDTSPFRFKDQLHSIKFGVNYRF
jgi:outer membrane immunogenic protein